MARVIRGVARVIPGAVVAAEAHARRLVEAARAHAEQIVESARKQAQEIEHDARNRGRIDGESRAAALLEQAQRQYDMALEAADCSAVQLAIGASERIVRAQLTLEPERIATIVGDLIERARKASTMKLLVHPDDRALLPALPPHCTVVESVHLQRGDCVLHSNVGDFDARIDVQVASLRRALEQRPLGK